jgi:hypothetical protein
MAQHLWDFGLDATFNGLQPTTLGQHFTDQHFLLHLLLRPFVTWIGLAVGTKTFVVLLLCVVIGLFAYLLKQLGTSAWWVGAILLATCNPWLFRLHLVKATPLALILIWLALLAVQKRSWLVLVISFLYVWSHGGFVLLPIILAIWSISKTISTWHWNWRDYLPVGYSMVGICAALLLQPGLPNNLLFYWEQLVQIGAVNYQHIIGVGGEWYPYDPGHLWAGHILLVVAVCIGLTVHIAQRRKWSTAQLAFTGYVIFFTLLTFKSKRYVEYLSPMLAGVAALYLHSLWTTSWQRWRISAYLPLIAIWIVIIPVWLTGVTSLKADLADGQALNNFSGVAQYLNQLPPDQVIAPSDWDDFPALWRGAPFQRYLIGLDPTFLYLMDAERYDAWKRLTLGETISNTDLDRIAADYYVVAKDHRAMYQQLTELGLQDVYSDVDAWVMR